jgi:hypothetical protein
MVNKKTIAVKSSEWSCETDLKRVCISISYRLRGRAAKRVIRVGRKSKSADGWQINTVQTGDGVRLVSEGGQPVSSSSSLV